jgi:hypothetical protein
MKTMISPYRIHPGEHCGSTSMRSLLEFYCGLELPEGVVFGLGAGIEAMYVRNPRMDPAVALFGRTGSLEIDIGGALGIDYREQSEADDAQAWQIAREEVLAGRPTMLTGDILYLDYREYKVHFPAHRFVLLGFDDEIEKAFIADRIRDVPEACSYGALAVSRNPPEGLSTHNLWGRFHGTDVGNDLRTAARSAIGKCAKHMLGGLESSEEASEMGRALSEGGGFTAGIAGIRELAADLPSWAERPDAQWVASFNARCIEKFGNGGGNFRRLYAEFLAWAHALDATLAPAEAAPLCVRAADGWTAISECLRRASEEDPDPQVWQDAARQASQVAELEQELFERLADRAG